MEPLIQQRREKKGKKRLRGLAREILVRERKYGFSTLGVRAAVIRARYRLEKWKALKEAKKRSAGRKEIEALERELTENPNVEIQKWLRGHPELWKGTPPLVQSINQALKTIDRNSLALLQAVEELQDGEYFDYQSLGPRIRRLPALRGKEDAIVDRQEWPVKPILGLLLPRDLEAPRIMIPDSEVTVDRRQLYKPEPREGEPIFPVLQAAYSSAAEGNSIEPFAKLIHRRPGLLRKDMFNVGHKGKIMWKGLERPQQHKPTTLEKTWNTATKILRKTGARPPFGLYKLDRKWTLSPITEPVIRSVLEHRVSGKDREEIAENDDIVNVGLGPHLVARIYTLKQYREACEQTGDKKLLKLWDRAHALKIRGKKPAGENELSVLHVLPKEERDALGLFKIKKLSGLSTVSMTDHALRRLEKQGYAERTPGPRKGQYRWYLAKAKRPEETVNAKEAKMQGITQGEIQEIPA